MLRCRFSWVHGAELSYAGRLTEASGKPVAGPVDLEMRFFGSAGGSDQLGPALSFSAVSLAQGVFQLNVNLSTADTNVIGWRSAGGKVFMTVSSFATGANPLVLTAPVVTYGTLVEGSPWFSSAEPNNRDITVP